MRNLGWSLVALGGIHAATPAAGQLPGECLDLVELGGWRLFEPTAEQRAAELPLPSEDGYTVPARIELSPEIMSTGFSGVGAVLHRDGAIWRGTLTTTVDYSPAEVYARPVTLAPADCSSPPPILASEDTALPRGVELASGAPVELGWPLPGGIATELRPSGAFTVLGEPTGLFGEASLVVAVVGSDSTVHRIEVHFPNLEAAESVATAIENSFPPGGRVTQRGRSWRNRTTTVLFSPSGGGGTHRIILIDPRLPPYS